MYFCIALLASHGTSRGYYTREITRNLGIKNSDACADNNGTADYRSIINRRLLQYSPERANLMFIDNSLASRVAPIDFYKGLFDNKTLIMNITRDPVKKFCSIYNHFIRSYVKTEKYELLNMNYTESILNLFYRRYWDNVMAVPYRRFAELSDNFIFFDSEDLREKNIRDTFASISSRICVSITIPEKIVLIQAISHADRILDHYGFTVLYGSGIYNFKLSISEQEKYTFMVCICNQNINLLLSRERLYVYTQNNFIDSIDPEDLKEKIEQAINGLYNKLSYLYDKGRERELAPEKLIDIIYSDVKIYDSFKNSIFWDAEYILSKNRNCEIYWDQFKKLDRPYPSPAKRSLSEELYSMRYGSGAVLLRDGWGEVSDDGVLAVKRNPSLHIPVNIGVLSLITLSYFSICSGSLTVYADQRKIASGRLEDGCLCFPVPAVLTRQGELALELHAESDFEPGTFTLYAVSVSPVSFSNMQSQAIVCNQGEDDSFISSGSQNC